MAAELSEIEELLASRIGLDPVSVGSPLILRAAQRRMKELGLIDMASYASLVRQSESELQALVEEVVVPESWFFRDERPFQSFREHVRTHWISDAVRPPLRVLSLPCAAGEEPYSIAMALRDLGLPVRRFCIDAVDISAHRLEIARRGVYSANAFRGSDLSYRARYFHEHPRGFELDSAIRSTVRFVQASVLDTGLLDGSPRYDVVFCRNLLIYLGADARVRVLAAIERLLKADGLLFIGHADRLAIAGVELKFSPAGDPACFGYRFAIGVAGAPAAPKIEPPWRVSVSPSKTAPPGYAAPIPVAVLPDSPALIAASTRADRVVHPTASCSGGDEPPLLDQAALLANQGRFDEAVVACECHLRIKGMSSPAYYLMGMIYQAAGNRTRAEDCFHKTVYLDPIHDEALLALALLAERRGDLDAAQGFRRRAERSATMSRKRVN